MGMGEKGRERGDNGEDGVKKSGAYHPNQTCNTAITNT